MPASWLHYWKADSIGHPSRPICSIGGENFSKRGVGSGDRLFVISRLADEILLVCDSVVEGYISAAEVQKRCGYTPYSASEHLALGRGLDSTVRSDRVVPGEVLRRLKFHRSSGKVTTVKFAAGGAPDVQTFRALRLLTSESAALLDGLLRPTGKGGHQAGRPG